MDYSLDSSLVVIEVVFLYAISKAKQLVDLFIS
jgi:hypothetical protein